MSKWTVGIYFLLFVVACQDRTVPDPPPQQAPDLAKRLSYISLRPAGEHRLLTLPAEAVLQHNHRFSLSPPVTGMVRQLLVTPGMAVSTGDPLAVLQVPSLAEWQALAATLQARVSEREQMVTMMREKQRLGLTSTAEVNLARQAVTEARLALTQWQQALTANQEAGLNISEDKLSWVWTTSHSGVVTGVEIGEGMQVSPGDSAITVMDIRAVDVRVEVPQRYLHVLGETPQLLWQPVGLPAGQDPLRLDLVRRDPVIDPITRSQGYYFSTLALAAGELWMVPGRTGRGTLVVSAGEDWLVVPKSAVVFLAGKQAVFMKTNPGESPRWRHVEVMGRNEEELLIRGTGFKAGDQVVSKGVFLLKSMVLLSEDS